MKRTLSNLNEENTNHSCCNDSTELKEFTEALTLHIGQHAFNPEFTYSLIDESKRTAETFSLRFDPFSLFLTSQNIPIELEDHVQRSSSESNALPDLNNVIDSYTVNGSKFNVHLHSFDSPEFISLHRRMEIFAHFFIEGASNIDPDEKWRILVIYGPDGFVGYMTMYNFLKFPDKIRTRISQFLILPPYRRQGHGTRLYQAAYQYLMSVEKCEEITVEDGNPDFMRLRTKCDLVQVREAIPKKAEYKLKLTKAQLSKCLKLLNKQ